MRVLAGDVGGTKTLLGLFERTERGLTVEKKARYESGAFPGLAAITRAFLAETGSGPLDAAAFAVAGPVGHGKARLTNLPWDELVESSLAAALSIPRVRLLNDFAAVAHGILDSARISSG